MNLACRFTERAFLELVAFGRMLDAFDGLLLGVGVAAGSGIALLHLSACWCMKSVYASHAIHIWRDVLLK